MVTWPITDNPPEHWTKIEDFQGGWCPCTGTNRKLPNLIVNIWFRQSGKTSNLINLILDYVKKYPSNNVAVVTLDPKIKNMIIDILSKVRELGNVGKVFIINQNNSFSGIEIADILLLDEFYFISDKNLSRIVSAWNSGKREGTVIAWSTLNGNYDTHNKILCNISMKGGTRTIFNYLRFNDLEINISKEIPTFLNSVAVNSEYIIKIT